MKTSEKLREAAKLVREAASDMSTITDSHYALYAKSLTGVAESFDVMAKGIEIREAKHGG